MGFGFDKWLLLKVVEFLFVLACFICKRVTDDEESRLFLYLQKLSREWPFLNSVTWDRVGSAVADSVYGGFLIITLGMILGRALKELPSKKRAMERFYLGIGAILFIILGGLEFAALDSIPPDLIDNAAVLGTLSITTAILFLIDMAAPRLKDSTKHSQTSAHLQLKPIDISPNKNNHNANGIKKDTQPQSDNNNVTKPKQKQKKFDIFGGDKDDEEILQRHSPVFSKVTKAQYGQYDNISPSYLRFESEVEEPPSSPGDPGYVQYTAKRWGQSSQKTPRNSPTDV